MKKSESLFGYRTMRDQTIIVVESPLDAVRLKSLGLNGIAIYGSFISKTQLNLIKSAARLVFALDNDDAGHDANKRIVSFMQDLWFEGWFFNYDHTDQKDIGGMSRDEVMIGLTNARHYVAMMQGV
jgi:DNA primase